LSVIHETIKKADKRNIHPVSASIIEPMYEKRVPTPARRPWGIVIGVLAFLTVLTVFFIERDRRIVAENQLLEMGTESAEKDARIANLVQENVELENRLKAKIEELEFTLKELNNSFDEILEQKKAIETDSFLKDRRLAELDARIQELEAAASTRPVSTDAVVS
jgi:uncharacterized protein HemX